MGSSQEGTPGFSAFLLGWTVGLSLRSVIQEEEQEVIGSVLNMLNRRGLWNIHVERQVLIPLCVNYLLYYLLLPCWDCLSSTSNFPETGKTVQSKQTIPLGCLWWAHASHYKKGSPIFPVSHETNSNSEKISCKGGSSSPLLQTAKTCNEERKAIFPLF